MWFPDKSKVVLVRFHTRGKDVETAWAEDLGSVPGRPGARRVRVGNVLAFHPKPTYGDVIVVERALPHGILTWNSLGLSSARVKERLDEDGRRYLVILQYVVDPPSHDVVAAYRALSRAGDQLDIVVEGCFRPEKGLPGEACLAVPYRLNPIEMLSCLRRKKLPLKLKVIYFDSAYMR